MRLRRELDFLEPRPDGYGLAWFRPEMATLVYYPIPLNLVMQALRYAYLWLLWGWWPSRREQMLQEARQAGVLQGELYHRGRGPNATEMAQLEHLAAYTTREEYDAHRIKNIDTEIAAAHEGT